MAIQLYCGLPRSGKSYGVVENVVIPAIQAERHIYTNLPLILTEIFKDYPHSIGKVHIFENDEVNGDFLMAIPGGAIIILDEVWRFWPSGLRANKMDLKEKEFFAEHGHKVGKSGLTQEICLITQDPSQIAKSVKDLVDQTVIVRKNDAVGSDKTYNLDIYQRVPRFMDSPGSAITSGMGRYKPSIYKYYESHTKSETGLPGIEKRADNRGSIWNHPFFKYVLPAILLASIWGVYKIIDLYKTGFGQKKEHIENLEIKTKEIIYPSKEQIVPVSVKITKTSESWRVVGYSDINGSRIVYAQNQNGRTLRLTSGDCEFRTSGPQCLFNGELITTYSGGEQNTVINYANNMGNGMFKTQKQ